jgi:tetratricopeptide (TPR) repeat protein
VVYQDGLDTFTKRLQAQPALAGLPFERWGEVLRQATSWGLLTPYPQLDGYLRLQPVLGFFLRTRLSAEGNAETRHAIETAFRVFYEEFGRELQALLQSKEPKERQVGLVLTDAEYENLATALRMSLAAHETVYGPYRALFHYLQLQQEVPRRLELSQTTRQQLEAYPQEALAGRPGEDLFFVTADEARGLLELHRLPEADARYLQALDVLQRVTSFSAEEKRRQSAVIYHQLGGVANEQRRFEQAEQYLQQALVLKLEFGDRFSAAAIYHQLGIVAQEQRDFTQAKQYYQQALAIYQEFGERYEQADTYHQLGRVTEEQAQWKQALQYYLSAVDIYAVAAQNDATAQRYLGMTLRSLARLWQVSGDSNVPARVATMLGVSQMETEALLRDRLPDTAGPDILRAPSGVTPEVPDHASAGEQDETPEPPAISAPAASPQPSTHSSPAPRRMAPAHPLIARGTAAGLLLTAAFYGLALAARTFVLAMLVTGLALAAVLTVIACLDALRYRRWGWAVLILLSTLAASVFIPGLGALLYGYLGPRRLAGGAEA